MIAFNAPDEMNIKFSKKVTPINQVTFMIHFLFPTFDGQS